MKNSKSSSEEFHNFLDDNHDKIAKILYDKAIKSDAKLNEECSDKYSVTLGKILPLQEISFDGSSSYPTEGQWQHRYEIERCGISRTHNVIFTAKDGEFPVAKASIMGNSQTSFVLAKDSYTSVYAASIAKLNKYCSSQEEFKSSFIIYDTKVIDIYYKNNVQIEIWSVKACDHTTDIDIKFTGDGMGGAYFSIT